MKWMRRPLFLRGFREGLHPDPLDPRKQKDKLLGGSVVPGKWIPFQKRDTVDGSQIQAVSPVEVGSLSHYFCKVFAPSKRWFSRRISEPSRVFQ